MPTKTIEIKSNTLPWSHRTNRHPTTDGNPWGWIEGTNITWSDNAGSSFTSRDASEVIAAHNRWLEDSKPIELKLIDARNKEATLRAEFDRCEAAFEKAKDALLNQKTLIAELLHAHA